MSIKKTLTSLLLAASAIMPTAAQQPFNGCWFPTNIEHWTPENDPSAKFNRSKVPLATRFVEPTLMKANSAQHYEGQVANATILFPMCSLCPSQGADNFIGYQPTYWQYMDKLIYWAGASNEGIINIPPAVSTDAAHAAGVKVLGNIFFPPKAFGGDVEWVKEMSKKDGNGYPYAKKLYEIAKYFGFDGWFINQETAGSGVKSATWAEFVKEFNALADAAGDTRMEIMWYNGSTVIDAPILTAHKNTSMFLDYHAVGDQRDNAKYLNCTPEETFSKIYAGIECVKSGLTGYNGDLNAAFPTDGHVGSVALFCPEQKAWRENVNELLFTANDCGEKAYTAMTKSFQNEEKAWVNEAGDPSTGGTANWRGISGAILERSTITSLPFVSNMCVGNGKYRFVDGARQATQDWNHSGVQSILPTWRWWFENRGNLTVAVDWDDAFNHGNCFHITGSLNGETLMRLYKTEIPINTPAIARVAYKGGSSAPALRLSTASSVNPDVTVEAGDKKTVNGWTVAEYDLSSLNGKTLYMIALDLKGSGKFDFKLGQVALLPASYAPAPVEIRNYTVTPRFDDEKGDIRLTWDYDWTDDFDHFDIYITELSGKKTLVGQTRGEGFYIPSVIRNGKDASVNVELIPVMKDMTQGAGEVAVAEFPKPGPPKVTLSLTKSYLKVGESTTINARGTDNPQSWKWTLPSTLELVEGSLSSPSVTVKALAEGIQTVSVESTNEHGTSQSSFEVLDVLAPADYELISNVALKKKIVSCSGSSNANEGPENLIDGVSNPTSTSAKWCNIKPESWVIIDCMSVFRLYGFKIFDCKAGPENLENFRDYTVEVSLDGKEWTKVVDEKDVADQSVKEIYIVPTRGRYIRFSPTVDGTLRVWEFEAYGSDVVKMNISADPAELTLNVGETKTVNVSYNLNGDIREKVFNCVATPSNGNVSIGTISENVKDSSFSVDIKGGEIIGLDEVLLTVNNGGAYKECVIKVTIDDKSQPNVLEGLPATLRHYASDYDPDGTFEEFTTLGLTDGDTSDEACEMIETPSSHQNDFWAIFEAPDVWYLSKVKIYFPNANFGINDNDKEGVVNNSVSIAVGDKIDNLKTVKTFDNLESISELECIFDKYAATRYLAIYCTLNPYFYPSLAEIEAFEQTEGAIAFNEPAEMTGWLQDYVAEGTPCNSYVNSFIEDESMYGLYTASVHETSGLPDDGFIRTATNRKYQIAPYDGNQGLSLNKDEKISNATLEFAEPALTETVHMLVFSGDASFQAKFKVRAIYEDGSEDDDKSYAIDGYKKASDAGVTFGLVVTGKGTSKKPTGTIDETAYKMFEKTLTVDPSKKLKALRFESTNYYNTNVIAISRNAYHEVEKKEEEEDGVEEILISTPERVVEGIYSLQGVKVSNPAKGIYIVRYTDGSAQKMIIR